MLHPDTEAYSAAIENALYNAMLRAMVFRPATGAAPRPRPTPQQRKEQIFGAGKKGSAEQKQRWLEAQLEADADPTLPPGIRYHSPMEGKLEHPNNVNTCCEGQGTRMFGSMPE